MPKFNTKIVNKTKTANKAGGTAFKFEPKVELINAVLTTFLDDKAYESGGERLNRIKALVSEIVNNGDAHFVANLAVVARKDFHMRSVSHVLVGELAKMYKGDDIVKNAIVSLAERPDDLSEIAAYCGLPMPKQVKRGIRNAILKFDRYQLAKYKMEGREFSLVDLFNLTHPKVQHATLEQRVAWEDLMNGNLKTEGTVESVLSQSDPEERAGNFEDLVTSGKIGYMALLRNINNVDKYKLSQETIKSIASRLSDPAQVAKSKQLPFRYLTAYEAIGNRILKDAVSEAMDIAVSNVPVFEGNTLIAIDNSGSMTSVINKAAIFGAVLMKANKHADVVTFNNTATKFSGSSRLPVVDLTREIVSRGCVGGTAVGSVFSSADKKYDRIFIVSDNESWIEAGGVMPYVNQYKRRHNADPFIYCIDIAGYGTKDISTPKAFHVSGWSEKILDFVKFAEQGASLVDYINSYKINK